jgi:hypothetical protein
MAAAKWERTDVIELLLINGASIEQRDKLGRTALDYASERRYRPDGEIARLLTPRGGVTRDTPGDARLPKTQEDREFVAKVSDAIKRIALSPSDGLTLSLAPGAHPILPGDDSSYERLECERLAAFTLTGSANELGGLSVSRCAQHAQRSRQLAANGAQGLLALQKGLPGNWDEAQARKAGFYPARRTLGDGSEFHYFPVIFLGHGVFVSPTAVLYSSASQQAVIVQLMNYPLCERENYRDLSLCKNPEQTLQKLAVEVLQGN